MKPAVLFVAQRPSDYVEMRRCALALREHGYRVQFFYHCSDGTREPEFSLLKQLDAYVDEGVFERVHIMGSRRAAPVSPRDAHPNRGLLWRVCADLYRRMRKTVLALPRLFARGGSTLLAYLQYARRMRALMADLRPEVIVLPEDVVGLITPQVIKAGHRLGVPSMIVPYTIANQEEAFQSLRSYSQLDARRWFNRPFAWLFPRWVMERDGVALLRLPFTHLLGHAITGTTPPDPWMMNSGAADVIAVENEAMFAYYRQAGMPGECMRVVGAIYDDYLAGFRTRREVALGELRAELGIESALPILLIGGCPDQTASCPPGFEFDDMRGLAAALADALRGLGDSYELLARPHPNFPALGEMLEAHGIRCTNLDTARLVALCDLYVAFGSATVRWAIACAVPTINWDVFHYGYSDFADVDGVVTVTTREEFRRQANLLRPGTPQLERLRAGIAASAPRWGRLDGHSVARIVELLECVREGRLPGAGGGESHR